MGRWLAANLAVRSDPSKVLPLVVLMELMKVELLVELMVLKLVELSVRQLVD